MRLTAPVSKQVAEMPEGMFRKAAISDDVAPVVARQINLRDLPNAITAPVALVVRRAWRTISFRTRSSARSETGFGATFSTGGSSAVNETTGTPSSSLRGSSLGYSLTFWAAAFSAVTDWI